MISSLRTRIRELQESPSPRVCSEENKCMDVLSVAGSEDSKPDCVSAGPPLWKEA